MVCYRNERYDLFPGGYSASAGGVAAGIGALERSGARGAGSGYGGGAGGETRLPDRDQEQLARGAECGGAISWGSASGASAGCGGDGAVREAAARFAADCHLAKRAQRGDRATAGEGEGSERGGGGRDKRCGRRTGEAGAISAGVRDGNGSRDFRGDVFDAGADGGSASEFSGRLVRCGFGQDSWTFGKRSGGSAAGLAEAN